MSNTLINTLDNHLCWRQWHLKNGVIMLTKVPYTFMVIHEMQQQTIKTHPISCLFDSGSDVTWIHQRAIPRHITIMTSGDPGTGVTMARTFTLNKTVTLHGLSLPELSPTWTIQQLQA